MRLRVPAFLLVTTGLVGVAALTNGLAGYVSGSVDNGSAASASALISAVSPAEASEDAPKSETSPAQPPLSAAAASPNTSAVPAVKVSGNMVCREAAWPYVQRRCETPEERDGQKVRHVRIISLDRGAPRNVAASASAVGVVGKAATASEVPPVVAATQGNFEASGVGTTPALVAAEGAAPASQAAVTVLPPARPDLAPEAVAQVATAAPATAQPAHPDVLPSQDGSKLAAAEPAPSAADPAPRAKAVSHRHDRVAHRSVREAPRQYARKDGDNIDPGYDPRSAVRTTVTYGYRYPDGRQYYYRVGPGGRPLELAYGDYPPAPRGYAYAPRHSLGESLFGWLSDD